MSADHYQDVSDHQQMLDNNNLSPSNGQHNLEDHEIHQDDHHNPRHHSSSSMMQQDMMSSMQNHHQSNEASAASYDNPNHQNCHEIVTSPEGEHAPNQPIYSIFIRNLSDQITETEFTKFCYQQFSNSFYECSIAKTARKQRANVKQLNFGFIHLLNEDVRNDALLKDWSSLAEHSKVITSTTKLQVGEVKNRIFIGNLSNRTNQIEVQEKIDQIIKPFTMTELTIKSGFGFLAFVNWKIADICLKLLKQARLVIETKEVGFELAKPDTTDLKKFNSKHGLNENKTIHIKGFQPNTQENDVREFFQNTLQLTPDRITSIRLVFPRKLGQQPPANDASGFGFCFMEFSTPQDAQTAVDTSPLAFNDSTLTIEFSFRNESRNRGPPREHQDHRGGGGGRDRMSSHRGPYDRNGPSSRGGGGGGYPPRNSAYDDHYRRPRDDMPRRQARDEISRYDHPAYPQHHAPHHGPSSYDAPRGYGPSFGPPAPAHHDYDHYSTSGGHGHGRTRNRSRSRERSYNGGYHHPAAPTGPVNGHPSHHLYPSQQYPGPMGGSPLPISAPAIPQPMHYNDYEDPYGYPPPNSQPIPAHYAPNAPSAYQDEFQDFQAPPPQHSREGPSSRDRHPRPRR